VEAVDEFIKNHLEEFVVENREVLERHGEPHFDESADYYIRSEGYYKGALDFLLSDALQSISGG